ncbi:MAG TPA: hypothetical protein VJK48_04070, partial [Chlamydiales bacterium]|nr:hypothetical protein [Chlamydiales bacterium]
SASPASNLRRLLVIFPILEPLSVYLDLCTEKRPTHEGNAEAEVSYCSTSDISLPKSVKSHLCEMEKKACEAKSSALWECVGRRLSETGEGFIYKFRAKPEYRNDVRRIDPPKLVAILANIFPAVEPSIRTVLQHSWYFPKKIPVCYENSIVPILRTIGYQISEGDDPIMELPDREAILSTWKKLSTENPSLELPNLSIASSDGIADDITYAESYFSHDALLSVDKEFVHDQHSHILPALVAILYAEKGRYSFQKEFYINQLKLIRQYIKDHQDESKYLSVVLGILADNYSGAGYSLFNKLPQRSGMDRFVRNLTLSWIRYLEKRFPEERRDLIQKNITSEWEKMKNKIPYEGRKYFYYE